MSKGATHPHQIASPACFEPLEERLMLTTLKGGEFFIYLNSMNQAVRVNLYVGDYSTQSQLDQLKQLAAIELLAYDGGIMDLPGIPGDDVNGLRFADMVGNVIETTVVPTQGVTRRWIDYEEPNPPDDPGARGAQFEIYAIYIAQSTADVVLTISVLQARDIPIQEVGPGAGNWLEAQATWYNDLNTWASSTPILTFSSGADPEELTAPDQSGGVFVGAWRHASFWDPDNPTLHLPAVPDPTIHENQAPQIGLFPGGDIWPGITVATEDFQLPVGTADLPVGNDVHAVAADSSGEFYVADLSAFDGVIVNDEDGGIIGVDVSSLASDSAGTFYAVDNDIVGTLGRPTDPGLGEDVQALAVDDAGVFYSVDEATHHLISVEWDPVALEYVLTDVGELLDAAEPTFRYDNVRALDYNSFDGTLYAIGTVTDTAPALPDAPSPAGPYLITIDTTNAHVTRRALINGGVGNYTTLAFDSSGTCYSVNTSNELLTIDTSDGSILTSVVLDDGSSTVTGVAGIDFIGDTLYGANTTTVYYINETTAVCTSLGAPDLGLGVFMGSLAYDPTKPGSLYTAATPAITYTLAEIELGSSLVSVDSSGAATLVDGLFDSSVSTRVWRDVYALDYNGSSLYAVASSLDLDPYTAASARSLITIDPSSGEVTSDVPLDVTLTDLETIAFAGTGDLYGVETTSKDLYEINPGTGSIVGGALATLAGSAVLGIEFLTIGANEVLYGVTATSLYAYDFDTGTQTGSGAASLLGNTGQTTLNSLTFDSNEAAILWSTADDGGYRLTRIDLSATLVSSNGVDTVTRVARIFDSANSAWAYDNIKALEFDTGDTLYGAGTLVRIDPAATAAPAGTYLITINTTTGVATRQGGGGTLSVDLTTLAYISATWYGVTTANNLVTVNMGTAALPPVGAMNTDGDTVVGLDDEDGTTYAVTYQNIYTVNLGTAACTLLGGVPDPTVWTLTSLTGHPVNSNELWSTSQFGSKYYLVMIDPTNIEAPGQEVGRTIIGGTIAGRVINPGSFTILEMGFLWGNIDIGENTDAIIMKMGGGALAFEESDETDVEYHAPWLWIDGGFQPISRITVDGTLNSVYSRGDVDWPLYSAIQVENDPTVVPMGTWYVEYENREPPGDAFEVRRERLWREGELVDWENNTPATARFLNHPTGNFRIEGTLEYTFGLDPLWDVDWYAVALMAGQTMTISGDLEYCQVYLFDFRASWLPDPMDGMIDSYGWKFSQIEPLGVYTPITFTAPAAGIYFVKLERDTVSNLAVRDYSLQFTGATAASLGAVSVIGHYGFEADTFNYYSGTGLASAANIATKQGGDLGAVMITGDSFNTVAYAIEGGNLVAFQAGRIGPRVLRGGYIHWTDNRILSDNNIGRVASVLPTVGYLNAEIEAGSTGLVYYPDAYIQNIYSAANLVERGHVYATGSIGVIEVQNAMENLTLSVNTDGSGPGGRIDLIDVRGDWGVGADTPNDERGSIGTSAPPVLYHGPGGDIGFIFIGGTIYSRTGGDEAQPRIVTDGRSTILNDDGGGRMTVTPQLTQARDAAGILTGLTYMPRYSYVYIPVEDSIGGVGGVIANLRIDGSARLSTTGVVQISQMDVSINVPRTATALDPFTELVFGGTGQTDIYYLHDRHTHSTLERRTFDITINGDLVSANLGEGGWGAGPDRDLASTFPIEDLIVERLIVRGNVGPPTGTTGAWLHGADEAVDIDDGDTDGDDISQEQQEAQYGWFHGRHNGLQMWGNLELMRVDGSVRDVRVSRHEDDDGERPGTLLPEHTGRLGILRVNADDYTPMGDWDGVEGIVWARDRIDAVYVGDGLADTGVSYAARAAIMSGYSIGKVEVSGPRTVINNRAYGEIHGVIAGYRNDVVTTTDERGFQTVQAVDGVGLVTATNGAWLNSAYIAGWDLELFQYGYTPEGRFSRSSVGTVSCSGVVGGVAAMITNSIISGLYIGRITAELNTGGISNTYVRAGLATPDGIAIREISAGGPGMSDMWIEAEAGNIGTVKGIGPNADIIRTTFECTAGMNYVGARDLRLSDFHMPGTIKTMNFTRHAVSNTVKVGAIDKATFGGDFDSNVFYIAAQIGALTIGGDFIDSYVYVQGPSVAWLKSLVVTGDISGQILSAGQIGQIISRTGGISADISTTEDGWNGDIALIQTAQAYTGTLEVAGSLGKFITGASLGDNPAATGSTQTFNIWQNVGTIKVGTKSSPANMYATVNIGGNLGTLDVSGNYYGNVSVNGGMTWLIVGGQMGGTLNFQETWTASNGLAWPAAWTFAGDTDQTTDLDIQSNRGRVVGDVAATGEVIAHTGHYAENVDQTVLFRIGADGMGFGLVARRANISSDTYYLARVIRGGAAGDALRIYKVVGGVETELANTGLLYNPGGGGTDYKMRFACTRDGARTILQAKLWDASGAEPGAWAAEVTDDEASLQGIQGRFGLYYQLSGTTTAWTDDYSVNFSRGSLTVMGELRTMKFRTTGDLYADLTIGGSIRRLNLRGGDLIGNLTSRYGSIQGINLNGGSIVGNVTAGSIGNITVRGGSITGDITTTDGDIRSVMVNDGNLDGSITAADGKIHRLTVINGSILAGNTIQADGGFRNILIRNGNLLADIISGRDIRSLSVIGGNITGATISAAAGIRTFKISGSLNTSTIRSGTQISRFFAGSIVNSIVSAGWHIGNGRVTGSVTGSHILAGYDVGPDGALGGGDDIAHSGNIRSLTINGNFNTSVAAAGIDPVNANFTDGHIDANGVSTIRRMTVRGSATGSMIMADTSIDPRAPAGAVVTPTNGTIAGAGTNFGPGTVVGTTLTVGGLTLRLTGVGVGNYHAPTNTLVLNNTTTRSSLRLANTGANVNIITTGSDDSQLGTFQTSGAVTLANTTIHGSIRRLVASAVANGATWNLYGGVSSALLGSLTNATITTGELRNWRIGSMSGGSLTADAFRNFTASGSVSGNLTTTLGGATMINLRGGSMSGDTTVLGTIRRFMVGGSLSGDISITNGDLQTLRVGGNVTGVIGVPYGSSRSVRISGAFTGSFRTGLGIRQFTAGSFSGLLSTEGDLTKLKVSGAMTGRARAAGSIRNVLLGSMSGAMVAAGNELRIVRIVGSMINSWLFAGFDPGDAGYIVGETSNLAIDAFEAPIVQPDQTDKPLGGSIRQVIIGGQMLNSTISAAVAPGENGYVNAFDGVSAGVGTVRLVRVNQAIHGTGGSTQSYGVFAASGTPKVYQWRNRPFQSSGTATVGTMETIAGGLKVADVRTDFRSVTIYFNQPVKKDTVGTVKTGMSPESLTVILSEDADIDPLVDTVISETVEHTLSFDSANYSVTLLLDGQTWMGLVSGTDAYIQVTLDGSVVANNRNSLLDGEYEGYFPSGDGAAGGDFVFTRVLVDAADSFAAAISASALSLTADAGTLHFGTVFESGSDTDIYWFTGSAYDYLSVQYFGGSLAQMAVFFRDDQGTGGTGDDTFEVLARHEQMSLPGETLFEAFELPEDGEYFIALAPVSSPGNYQVAIRLSSSDSRLGALPSGEEIAYVSNVVGDQNNNLGANNPKQLVYLDFDGGTATKYFDTYGEYFDVSAFDLLDVDPNLDGLEDTIIDGGGGVTGIVDNVLSVFTNTPATHPLGSLTVQRISAPADWTTYQAATEGLWFTTIDPATGPLVLDPETDFTTVFIGEPNYLGFTGGGILGEASTIDVANQSKADNAIVVAPSFAGYMEYASLDQTTRLNELSRAFAITAAHELGHVLGLNHQPTTGSPWLNHDDPDNNTLTTDDSNTGLALMAYASATQDMTYVAELGTASLPSGEFPVGEIDTADLLLRWLS